jgi:hypothetical protein
MRRRDFIASLGGALVACPLAAFVETHCVRQAEGRCLVKSFYAAYTIWTRDMGYTLTQTQQTVTRNLAVGFATKKTKAWRSSA